MNQRTVGLLGAVALLLLPGCERKRDRGAAPSVAAEVREQVIDRSRRLTLRESWRIGHAEDRTGTQLYRVRGADVASNASVFVLDSGNDRVLVVDSTGSVVRQFGGPGGGPGEFGRAGGVVVRRDTVLVLDSNRRVHFFQADGNLIATHRLRFEDPEVNRPSMVASSAAGWFVFAEGYFRAGGVGRPPLRREHMFRVRPETGELTATGLRWSKESAGLSHNNFFWLEPILVHRAAMSPDGLGRFLVSDTATYRVDINDMDGSLQLRIENEVEPIPINDAVIDLWRASRDCPDGPEMAVECSREMDQKTLSLPRTEHRPVVLRLRAHRSGHFSILRGDLDPNPFDRSSPMEYDHFEPDGTYLGSTSGVIPLSFDGRIMISLEPDSLGMESVVRYRVDGPSAQDSAGRR